MPDTTDRRRAALHEAGHAVASIVLGIPVEYTHHEVGPSQHEIDMRFADGLDMADRTMTYRIAVKEVAMAHGYYATFMPKPLFGENGSGMHTHQSLFKGDQNAFYDADDEYHLSDVAKSFIAGQLKHAREITSVFAQWVNSYKRLWGGNEAPSYICWGHNNRSALLRIPQYKPGKGNSARIEFRALDPGANPYLAYSVLLAAGLGGVGGPVDEEGEFLAFSRAELAQHVVGRVLPTGGTADAEPDPGVLLGTQRRGGGL